MTDIEFRGNTSWLRKGVVAVSALIVALCVASPVAFGAVIDPLGSLGQGPVKVKFSDFETLITGPQDTLSGIFSVTSIHADNPSNTLLWSQGDGNAQLNGYFSGLSVVDFTAPTQVDFSGGHMVLYLAADGSFDAAVNPNTIDPTGQLCGGACGTPWLTADFVPGVLDPNQVITLHSSTTLPTNPPEGHGIGYLSVATVGGMTGTANDAFDQNGYLFSNNPAADLQMQSDFTICTGLNQPGSCDSGWSVVSEDPVRATIPEPGTVALIGLGLLGLSLTRRRNRA